jgi:SRSO17 transposase
MVKPRPPRPTVQCVDTYCELYKDLFIEVRAYESFKYLQLGLISELKRKSLPAIAKVLGLENAQGLLDAVALCWKPTRPRCIAASFC